jgi:hypothetical protein
MIVLNYAPGQKVTFFLDTFDVNGVRADGYDLPFVSRVIFPDLSLSAGFPQYMVKLDIGLYYFQFTLPINADAVGSYLIDVNYWDPVTTVLRQTIYQVIVSAPFGNFTASVSV